MHRWLLSLLALFIALPLAASEPQRYEPRANLTLLADESLMLPLADLTRDYATRTRTPVTVVVKNAAEAERQIEQGLEAHVVITANYPLLNRITEQGLTDVSSRRVVARTRLALVTSSEVRKTLNIAERLSFASMLKATGDMPILAMAETTLEGMRTQTLLSDPDFADIFSARVAYKLNTEEIFNSLRDEPGLALVLATSSVGEPDIVLLSVLPDDVSPAVTYDVVVLASELMDEAKSFAAYLSSREAQSIFAHYGYQAPR